MIQKAITFILIAFSLPSFASGTFEIDYNKFAHHFINVLKQGDSASFYNEFFPTKEKVVASTNITLKDTFIVRLYKLGGLKNIEKEYETTKEKTLQTFNNSYSTIKGWIKREKIDLNKVTIVKISSMQITTSSSILAGGTEVLLQHNKKYYSIMIQGITKTELGWFISGMEIGKKIDSEDINNKYKFKTDFPETEKLASKIVNYLHLYNTLDSAGFQKNFLVTKKEEKIFKKQMPNGLYKPTNSDEKINKALNKIKKDIGKQTRNSYKEIKAITKEEQINLDKIELIDYAFKTQSSYRSETTRCDGTVVIRHKGDYYRFRIKKAFWIKGKWHGGTIDDITNTGKKL